MNKAKKIFKKWRVILLLLFLLFSFLVINPQFDVQGVAIKNIAVNSTAADAGMVNPSAQSTPTSRELILTINGVKTKTIEDYASALDNIKIDETIRLQTNKQEYIFLKTEEDIGVTITEAASNNIRKGLELQGGTRVLLKPETQITDSERDDLISVMENRLNTYGLTDITIRRADDLLGNKYILVEIAGASKQEVKELIEGQGKFEAKIGDEVVFEGGKKDVTFVCRNDGTCSGIRDCYEIEGGEYCKFQFSIALSAEAAKRHAEITKDLEINITESGTEALEKPLDIYLDGQLVDSLLIMADLKGQETTQISISGPGYGVDRQEAIQNAVKNMNKLQTVLITGSLPTKLEIVKLDSISPALGTEFVKNAIRVALFALLAVAVVVFIRYRKLKITIPMLIAGASEIIIILGFAALIRYNLDLAAIAGIIAAVGTGVDDQIIIVDEVLSGETEQFYKWNQRIKRAFFIIMIAYATTVAAMLPLLKAGAGLVTGFALTTIAGITIGVLITRPAFAAIVEVLLEE